MKTDGDATILVDPAPAPSKGAATYRATGASFADGVLTVTVAGGGPVKVPPGATVIINGFPNPPEYVPLWFHDPKNGYHAQCRRVEDEAKQLIAAGAKPRVVPPVRFTLADTPDGTVARFDNS